MKDIDKFLYTEKNNRNCTGEISILDYYIGYGYRTDYGYGDGYGFGHFDGSGFSYEKYSNNFVSLDFDYDNGYGSGKGTCEAMGSGKANGSGCCNEIFFGPYDSQANGYGAYDGNGYGYGYRFDNSIKKINNQQVVSIDNIHTIIENIHGNYAKGYILNEVLSTTPCFIAKYGDYFAHGKTLAKAREDAQIKYEENLPIEKRIELFNKKYPDNDKPIDGNELFDYHNKLTGSCLLGRQSFCKERGLDINSKYTVREFIAITEDAYGKEVIKKLKESRGL